MNHPPPWRSFAWWLENADAFAVIAVVLVMSTLGVADVVSATAVAQATPAVLGVLSLVLLRDRVRSHTRDQHLASVHAAVARMDQKIDGMSALRILHGYEVGDVLLQARDDTTFWTFRGGTGTYTRVVTLPDCVARARPKRRALRIQMEILDPTNLEACAEYASMYRSLSAGSDDDASNWTADGTRRESYATVLAACWHRQRYAPLSIEIGLSTTISTFRYDLSSRCLVVTQRGPHFQALLVGRGMPHYDYWGADLDMSFRRSRQVAIGAIVTRFPLVDSAQPDVVRELFARLDLDLPAEYTDDDVREIVRKATVPESNPLVRGAGDGA